nr:unnamed protein product [Naegleria fowleri]
MLVVTDSLKPKHTQAYEQLQEKFKNPEEVKQKFREKKRKQWEERRFVQTQPTLSVILKGLSNSANEEEITNIIYNIHGLVPTRVRIVRDKETGQSRGFGFVDFSTVEESQMLMDSTAGGMFIGNDYVELEYSHKAAPIAKPSENVQEESYKEQIYQDWICGHCNTQNFMHRDSCFGCSHPRDETAQEVITKQSENISQNDGLPPTVELIVRGLNILTTETTLLNVFGQFAPVKACRVIKDKVTQISRQFGFVEFYSVEDATRVLSMCSELFIDGVRVNVAYAKRQHVPETEVPATEDVNVAQWNALYNYTGTDEKLEEKQKKIETKDEISNKSLSQCGFVFDEETGYYYNSQLNYYYDTKTGYYYDCAAGVWMYYDEEKKTYIPFPQEESATDTTTSETTQSVIDGNTVIGPLLPQTSEEKEEIVEVISSGGFVPNPKFNEQLKILEKEIELAQLQAEPSTSSSTKQGIKRKRDVKPKESIEEVEKKEIDDENVGKKLLEKLGWTKGEGLGRNKSGITAPISVKPVEKHSGLGFAKSSTAPSTKKRKESYQKEGMKVLQKRFNEIEEEKRE